MSEIRILPLFSGSKGNSVLVINGDNIVLVDVGVSRQRIDKKLKSYGYSLENVTAILLTHAHIDHVKGLDIVMKYSQAKLYCQKECCDAIGKYIEKVDFERIEITKENFNIGNMEIRSFHLPHDAHCTGYTFKTDDDKIAVFTDLGQFDERLFEVVGGAKKVYIESNHDVNMVKHGAYPYQLKRRILSQNGHLSNEDCGKVCQNLYKLGARTFLLSHLSEENNSPEMAFSAVNTAIQEVTPLGDFGVYVVGKEGLEDIF